jgi:hypothetical protein
VALAFGKAPGPADTTVSPDPDIAGRTRHLHPQQRCSGLEQRHVTRAPLMPGQQTDRFPRRHAESFADRGRRGDAAVFQFPADQHA